ncbi:MAG: hypothetical protein ACTSRA_19710, partial [Promethearchaeota archaeon]
GLYHECGHSYYKWLTQNNRKFSSLILKNISDLQNQSPNDPKIKSKKFVEEIFSDYFDLIVGFRNNFEKYFNCIWDYLSERKAGKTREYHVRMLIILGITMNSKSFLEPKILEKYQHYWQQRKDSKRIEVIDKKEFKKILDENLFYTGNKQEYSNNEVITLEEINEMLSFIKDKKEKQRDCKDEESLFKNLQNEIVLDDDVQVRDIIDAIAGKKLSIRTKYNVIESLFYKRIQQIKRLALRNE